jgi:two-component system alkaline phosphatase synthesis response regulator PhoP
MVGGWQVTTASSGEEGLAAASRVAPDAILLDVMMPGLDGPSTFGRLQENSETAAIPVVLLTAKVQPSERQQWLDLGVAGVQAKPFDPMTLPAELAELLGWTD